jgi:hypothetical protein
MAIDYEAIAEKKVGAMNLQDLNRFLVICALVSDLYCPGFNPRQALGKDSNLAPAAARYKIDTAQLGAQVRSELTKRKEKTSKPKAA